MPEMHQPPSDPSDPDTVEPTSADDQVPPVVEDGEELGEVAGGGEITDIGPDSPSS